METFYDKSNWNDCESLLEKGKKLLEESEWEKASEYFYKVLDISPNYASAYIGLLCVVLEVESEEKLSKNEYPLSKNEYYQKAIQYADPETRKRLYKYNQTILKKKKYEDKILYKIFDYFDISYKVGIWIARIAVCLFLFAIIYSKC